MQKITSSRQQASMRGGLLSTFLAAVIISVTGLLAPMSAAEAKNTFVFANASPYDTMDPQVVFDVGRVAYRLNLYDGLMRWLDNPPKLHPWLAESYDISADGKQYTFTLRANAKFHDGAPVEAKDVVYSIDRILALKKGASSLFVKVIKPGSTKAIAVSYTHLTLPTKA